MKQANSSKGSILLLFLFTSTALMTIGLNCWYCISMNVDSVVERERFYQQYYAAELLLNRSIPLICYNFDTLIAKKEPIVVDCTSLMRGMYLGACQDGCQMLLVIKKPKNSELISSLMVHVQLSSNNVICCDVRCMILCKTVFNEGKKKYEYCVQHYTLGTVL